MAEIDLALAGAEEIRARLSVIYGEIALVENRGSYLMGRVQ